MELYKSTIVQEVLRNHISRGLLELSFQPHGRGNLEGAEATTDIGASTGNPGLRARFRRDPLRSFLWKQLDPALVRPVVQTLRRQGLSAYFLQTARLKECHKWIHSKDGMDSPKVRSPTPKQSLCVPLLQPLHVSSGFRRNAYRQN